MTKKLPITAETVRTLQATPEAEEILNNLLERKQALEDYVAVVQPLFYALSIKLYGDDSSPIELSKLVEDGIKFLGVEIPKVTDTQTEGTLQ